MISSIRDREITRTEQELESTARLLAKQFDGHLETVRGRAQVGRKISCFKLRRGSGLRLACWDRALPVFFFKEKLSDASDFAGVNIFQLGRTFLKFIGALAGATAKPLGPTLFPKLQTKRK